MAISQNHARATGPALEAAYQFALWLAPTVEKFPRTYKFALGDRMLQAAYDVLERLLEATYSRDRRAPLLAANLLLQKLRLFCRMALDLHHLDQRRFEFAIRSIDEIGRLVGGWMKANSDAGRAGHAEADVVVPVVACVPVAISGAEVLWIVVPRAAAQNGYSVVRAGPRGGDAPTTVRLYCFPRFVKRFCVRNSSCEGSKNATRLRRVPWRQR